MFWTRVSHCLATLGLLLTAAASTGLAEEKILPLPEGSKVSTSFRTDKDQGPEKLFDGDEATFMMGAGGSCLNPTDTTSVQILFAQPVENLAGVQTGQADPFGNYYPIDMEFHVDGDGDGVFEIAAGKAGKLGPMKESAGKQMFEGRVAKAHGLEIRVTKQGLAGGKRAWSMNEIKFITSDTPKALVSDIQSVPAGTKATASFGTDKTAGPEALIDGKADTFMTAAGNTCPTPTSTASVFLKFPQPLENLAGVYTGESCKFHNYYPIAMEFWIDSDGDGRCDTLVGETRKLGPAKQSVGRQMFNGRLPKAYALELRAVEQSCKGAKRAWTMNEVKLIYSDKAKILEATPDSYKVLYFTDPMPAGTTITASFKTEPDKGPEVLLDRDPKTFMAAEQGTAKEGKPASLFLRLPEPATDLAGIVLGKSDPFANYVWETMEVHADTTGDGKYDTLAATFSAGSGERRFKKILPKAYGLELRVTKQSLKGTFRCFALNEIEGLVFKDEPGEMEMRYVVEDFEDFASWRTWASNTAQPEGERYYGEYTFLCGKYQPDLARNGVGVGQMRYCFKTGVKGSVAMWATRGIVYEQEGLIDKITFWANPQGYDCSIAFEINDANGKKARTPGAKLSGDQWKQYSLDINAETVRELPNMKFPLRIKYIWMSSEKGGTGDVLLDDLTLVGMVDRSKRVRITPAYEGMAYDPAKPLVVKYRLWNALGKNVQAPLEARLYSSFDGKFTTPIATRSVPVNLPPYSDTVVTVDFGKVDYGHYHAALKLTAPGVAARATDPVAVLTLNGKRINQSPMYFGSMHPGDWIAKTENEFVFKNVVVPLGLDCYRTGAPDKAIVDAGLLCAAGFGGVPPELRTPEDKQKNDARGEPIDYDKYYEWVKKEAREKYLPHADKILSVEFYNEPDLPNFCYKPEIDVFLKMHRTFAKAFREVIPGIKIGTGGNTVEHGKAKKDFNSRMYTELAQEADVAIWHAHGPLTNYTSRHHMVEAWLEKGGRSKDKALLGNSETGLPSGSSPVNRLVQADALVKKIGWAKAQRNSYFYIWFTTTDTFDPQGGYLGGEYWGLITVNQRLKPSGQAYNEIIRQLANTTGQGEVQIDPRLQACHYTRANGDNVWLCWPKETGAAFVLPLAVSANVTITDMFGKTETAAPKAGKIVHRVNGYPFYINAPKGVTVASAAAVDYVKYTDQVGGSVAQPVTVKATFKNVWNKDVTLEIVVENSAGKQVAKDTLALPAGQSADREFRFDLPKDAAYGTHGYTLRVSSEQAGLKDELLPVAVVVAEYARKVGGPFVMDGKCDKLANAGLIELKTTDAVQDLAYDPNTPYWKDADDLSVKTTLAHDAKGLYLCFTVTDQTHKPGKSGEGCWNGDSIQAALYFDGKHTEIGLTEADGGTGWVWISPDDKLARNKLTAPLAVKREGNTTTYEVYLPFEMLGGQYTPGKPVRFTFLVNEDDGRGRVRIMKWFNGIAAGKDLDKFGHLMIE